MTQFTYSHRDLLTGVRRATPTDTRTEPTLSAFDSLLTDGWRDRMSRGVFRYHLGDLQTRVLPGPGAMVAQLNVQRGVERRKPQEIQSIKQPYDPRQFNFNKVRPDEVLFEMTRLTDPGGHGPELHRGTDPEGHGPELHRGTDPARHGPELNRVTDPVGHGPELHRGTESGGVGPEPQRVTVLVNVSPLEFGHCVFVPEPTRCLPQVLTLYAIQTGIESVLLSSDPGFRVGFNSLGAFASVNHLHLHGYYLTQELLLETVPVQPLVPEQGLYRLTNMPRGFLFYTEPDDLEHIARVVFRVSQSLVDADVAHNLFLTRGSPPGDGDQRKETRGGVRIALWPRRSSFGTKEETAFNVALCELAGHLPFKVQQDYETMTETDVRDIIETYLLPEEDFIHLEEQLVAELMQCKASIV